MIPADELKKLGFNDGDEVEFSKNEANEVALKFKEDSRKQKITEKTRDIIERRRSALVELGKGHEWKICRTDDFKSGIMKNIYCCFY